MLIKVEQCHKRGMKEQNEKLHAVTWSTVWESWRSPDQTSSLCIQIARMNQELKEIGKTNK